MIEHIPRAHTRERILDIAERLFVENGISATSIRDITQATEINLSAVNYYFGSKDGLIKAAFTRNFLPFIHTCSKALHNLPQPAPLSDIVRAILLHMEELADLPEQRGIIIINLLSRILSEHSALVLEDIDTYTPELTTLLIPMLRNALPELTENQIRRRLYITFKIALYSLNGKDPFKFLTNTPKALTDMHVIIAEMQYFIEAGLSSAPMSMSGKK